MKLELSNIHNKHKDKIGLVAGLGTSLKSVLVSWENLSSDKENYITFSCNRYHILTNLDVDYWLICNNQPKMQICNFHEDINSKDNILVYADSVDLTSREAVDSLIINDYLSFDQRHFKGKSCEPIAKCCSHIIPKRLTIQEYLQDIAGASERYGYGSSVILHALTLAIISGCNPIYISGVDFDYDSGYVNVDPDNTQLQLGRAIGHTVKEIVKEDLEIIKRSAELINVKIYTPNADNYLSEIFEVKNHE